jgi:hypothetical protein
MIDLKIGVCPFCKEDAGRVGTLSHPGDTDYVGVECDVCSATGPAIAYPATCAEPPESAIKEAITRWNEATR